MSKISADKFRRKLHEGDPVCVTAQALWEQSAMSWDNGQPDDRGIYTLDKHKASVRNDYYNKALEFLKKLESRGFVLSKATWCHDNRYY